MAKAFPFKSLLVMVTLSLPITSFLPIGNLAKPMKALNSKPSTTATTTTTSQKNTQNKQTTTKWKQKQKQDQNQGSTVGACQSFHFLFKVFFLKKEEEHLNLVFFTSFLVWVCGFLLLLLFFFYFLQKRSWERVERDLKEGSWVWNCHNSGTFVAVVL